MTSTQTHTEAKPATETHAPRAEGQPLLRAAGQGCQRLVADLSGLFTHRRQQRAGLYLPLVRVDRSE